MSTSLRVLSCISLSCISFFKGNSYLYDILWTLWPNHWLYKRVCLNCCSYQCGHIFSYSSSSDKICLNFFRFQWMTYGYSRWSLFYDMVVEGHSGLKLRTRKYTVILPSTASSLVTIDSSWDTFSQIVSLSGTMCDTISSLLQF